MERLRASDVRGVVGFVADAFADAPRGGFRMHVIERLRALVPSDMTAWVETRIGRPEVAAIASPHDLLADGPRRFARIRDQHPVLAHFERSRHGGARKLSDFLGRARYHRLPIYQEFFRPAGIEHQMSIALPSTGARLVRITLNRARGDFSERDRLVLDLVRPHIAEAHEHAEALDRLTAAFDDVAQATDALEVGVVTVRAGRVTAMNARARALLAAHFAPRSALHRRLPDALADWLARQDRAGADGELPPLRRPFVVEHGTTRLEVRAAPRADGHVLVLRERLTAISARPLEALGLTRRRAEVLAWLAQGKTNGEIASILGISPNTVARHVETILVQLGVATRTAAAGVALTHLASL
jgi:DNA-binding CsgD family transcriptional regulator